MRSGLPSSAVTVAGAGALVAAALVLVGVVRSLPGGVAARPSSPPPGASSAFPALPPTHDAGAERSPEFRVPSGKPVAMGCLDARRIAKEARHALAFQPRPPAEPPFASALVDWFDPHGLWSVTTDSTVGDALEHHAPSLLAAVTTEGADESACAAATEVGAVMVDWIAGLRRELERGRATAGSLDPYEAASGPYLDEAVDARSTPAFVRDVGRRLAALERAGGELARAARLAEARLLPAETAEAWADVVMAASLRAYVPLLDPHSEWAPRDEETSLYELDLDANAPAALWSKAKRTPVGLRIEAGAYPPLAVGDVVLSLEGHSFAGLSFEAAGELALWGADRQTTRASILRSGERSARSLVLTFNRFGGTEDDPAGRPPETLVHERIRISDGGREADGERGGDVLAVGIRNVRDDLGDEFAGLLRAERAAGPLRGLVLDLRGNGGGSTDGAADLLGILLPGVPLFPLKRSDGTVFAERALEPAAADRFSGPVMAMVDGNTASAAEMIAGALAAYHRGLVVGTRTYGKGCAQEYQDDALDQGVFRLTTLLYALPDGTPVQRMGLTPTLELSLGPTELEDPVGDREADLPNAPPVWRGPDLRDAAVVAALDATHADAWPHADAVGPCRDAEICRAVEAVVGGRSDVTGPAPRPGTNAAAGRPRARSTGPLHR